MKIKYILSFRDKNIKERYMLLNAQKLINNNDDIAIVDLENLQEYYSIISSINPSFRYAVVDLKTGLPIYYTMDKESALKEWEEEAGYQIETFKINESDIYNRYIYDFKNAKEITLEELKEIKKKGDIYTLCEI